MEFSRNVFKEEKKQISPSVGKTTQCRLLSTIRRDTKNIVTDESQVQLSSSRQVDSSEAYFQEIHSSRPLGERDRKKNRFQRPDSSICRRSPLKKKKRESSPLCIHLPAQTSISKSLRNGEPLKSDRENATERTRRWTPVRRGWLLDTAMQREREREREGRSAGCRCTQNADRCMCTF